jgi:pimeloyl-ACP methyl ester carboxylesterase
MPRHSTIARLQRLLTCLLASIALTWVVATWSMSPLLAIGGAILIVLCHSLFLAAEFVLLVRTGSSDPTPRPEWSRIAQAWWGEIWQDVRVFAWRQPFRWREVPDYLGPDVRGNRGVVFIHGFMCNRGFWSPWLKRLRGQGHAFVAVNLEPIFSSIDDYVPVVERAVQQVTQATGAPPLLVCHSMGGLAARAWLRRIGSRARVHHVMTIGTPHQGTWLARFSRVPNGREMRQDSPWLRTLRADEGGRPQPPFTCWYSNCDNVVFPPQCGTLPGADNRLLPGAAHVDLAFRPAVFDTLLDLLR